MGIFNKVNIALSGWSGAGATTMTLMLAVLMKRLYYPITEIFREVVRRLVEDKSSNHQLKISVDSELPDYEKLLQAHLGRVVDEYVDWVLLNKKRVILETDLSVFRLGKCKEVFSVFLKTDFKTRVRHFVADGREGGEETLRRRDQALRKAYRELWGIDVFDEKLIKEKFNLVIDNSYLTIEETVRKIGVELRSTNYELWNESVEKNIKETSKYDGPEGKRVLREKLEAEGLLAGVKEMVKEINGLFEEEIKGWSEELKRVWKEMG